MEGKVLVEDGKDREDVVGTSGRRTILVFLIPISMHVSMYLLRIYHPKDVLWLKQFPAIMPYAA